MGLLDDITKPHDNFSLKLQCTAFKTSLIFLSSRVERGGPNRSRPELVRVQGVIREPVLRGHGTFLHSRVHRISSAESCYRVYEKSREAS